MADQAGASAAVFAARARLRTLVLDSDKGMTRRAQMNNLLGFPDGISGPELVERGQQHARKAGADWQNAEVTALQPADDSLHVTASDGRTFDADQVLLTTGATAALASQAGVTIRPGAEPRMKEAIVVDDQGRTNMPRLWAARRCRRCQRPRDGDRWRCHACGHQHHQRAQRPAPR